MTGLFVSRTGGTTAFICCHVSCSVLWQLEHVCGTQEGQGDARGGQVITDVLDPLSWDSTAHPWCPQALDSKPPLEPAPPRRAIGSSMLCPASFGPARACFSFLLHLPILYHSSSPSFETQVSPRKPALVTVWSLPPLSPLLPRNMQTTYSQSWKRPSEQPSPKSPEGRGMLEPRASVSPSQLYSTQVVSGRGKAPQNSKHGPHAPSGDTASPPKHVP